jgi:hypothetical protein
MVHYAVWVNPSRIDFGSLKRVYSQTMESVTKATPEHVKFTKALASVLSASPEQIRESRAQAKAEKPSPHTRYTYAPEEGQP